VPYEIPTFPAGVDEDAWAATVAEVRAFCGWHIAPEVTETLTLDGPGGYVLVLPTLHLVDLVSVTNDGTAITDPEWPAELLSVMTEMASTGTSEWSGVKAVTSGPHQVTFETSSVSSASREVLGRYQLPFIA
jgi:hypothetical protein